MMMGSNSTLWHWLALALAAVVVMAQSQIPRNLRMLNESGHRLEVYWVSPQGEASMMTNPYLYDGATFPLNTFVGHRFEIREVPNAKTGDCAGEEKVCRRAEFVVSENDDQAVRIAPGLEIEFRDNKVMARREADSLVTECEENAKTAMSAGDPKWMDNLAECVEIAVARKLEVANEEIAFQAQIRTDMATLLENYTCADEHSEATPDVRTEVWTSEKDGVPRAAHIKLDRPASRIHVVDNFIDPIECEAMESEAARTLHRATVADGKGGSRLSENRKAMQAGISVRWDREEIGDPIARLSRRVYDYANHVLGLGIEEHGQEDLMSIQYFGRGRNDTEPDRYTPHCDGDCTGLPHKTGTRMATMVMYCTLPSEGGATNFKNSGVHVKPVAGSAVFFSYIDPEARVMDTGFTEHSGCPVFEGEKKIVTQWIRLGVDSENPWNSFNTLGIKHADAANQ
uniref:Fe2OG dioxygenase domain-containing protein n=1 Tax=Grammatophora oceanica TaxID=210454 RepID=A0A7S1Y7T8_9STRA|mmetsp:Transcript_30347/g.44882  ORF Transcript_30347/g.44882 Transcript_30347/m.44882 type:complete len:456 (+) Transcript_30347:46-1413(+)